VIPDELKKRLQGAAAAGVIGLSAVLANWYEGTVYTVYLDPAGVPTVCAGITGPDVVLGKTYTQAECDQLLDKHQRIAQAAVKRVIKAPLNQWQEAALIDFTFNLGETRLAGSTMAKLFNAGRTTEACDQLSLWVNARVKGQLTPLPGLVNRRGTEEDLCLGKIP